MRLNKFIAQNFPRLSRRQADQIIAKNLVEINGKSATLGQQILDTDKVRIFIEGQWYNLTTQEIQTILFYKPIFSITSKSDPQKRKTIYDFLPLKFRNLKPAGRLDYMSEGLLVLSSDGDLIQDLTHPSSEKTKTYLVQLSQTLEAKDIETLKQGLKIDNYKLNEMIVKITSSKDLQNYSYLKLNSKSHKPWYFFILSEGRNNQIRNTMEVFDRKVLKLIRVSQGQFHLTEELYNKKYLEI
jgi:23S rRNA pseudouridine2605 synthase